MKRLAVLCFAAIASAQMYAQQARLDSVFTNSSEIAVENIFLHLDKYACLTGDSMWLKAYVLADAYHPSSISTNLYVELFNDQNRLVTRKLFPIVRSESIGTLPIPDSLHTGTYWVRAFTRYQTNFDSAQFFTVPVTIYNPNDKIEVVAKKRKDPEPGPTVSYIDSSLFWITQTNDTGVICRFTADSGCALLNQHLHVVLASYHQPIFRASLSLNNQKDKIISFPAQNLQGYVDLLLLNDSGLLARQSIFLAPKKNSIIDVQTDVFNSSTLGYNDWSIRVKDTNLYQASISITDADLPEPPYYDIFQYPAPDPFDYYSAMQGVLPFMKYKNESYLTWTGVVKTESGKPVKQGELIALISKDSLTGTGSAEETKIIPIDTKGRFVLNSFFFDTAMVSFQLNDHSGKESSKNIQLCFDNKSDTLPLLPRVKSAWVNNRHHLDTAVLAQYTPPPPGAMVKELPKYTVRGWKDARQELDTRYPEGMFSELTPFSYDVRNEKKARTVWEYLRRELPGFSGGLDSPDPPSLNGTAPLFYVNDQLQSLDELNSYWFVEIAYIKVFKSLNVSLSPYEAWKTGQNTGFSLVGNNSGNSNKFLKMPVQTNPPVVCLYTRKGTDIRTGWAGLSHRTISGYSPIAKFTGTNENRWTLYWEPLARISHAKEFHVQFLNNNRAGDFRVVVEGISPSGKLVEYENIIYKDHGTNATAKL